MTEEQMLTGSIRNNAAAQEAFYDRFSPRMLGVCYRFAKSREDAEDMLQEGFIKILSINSRDAYASSQQATSWTTIRQETQTPTKTFWPSPTRS